MANTYTLIEGRTLTTTAASVTFTSIPQTYTDLKLVWTGRQSRNVFNAAYTVVQFNSSSSNYTYRTLQGEGTNPASQTQAGLTTDGLVIGGTNNSNNTANSFSSSEMYIPNYTSSNYKSVDGVGTSEQNVATGIIQLFTAGLWSDSAAITSITLKPWVFGYFDWLADSTFYLYGIKNS